MTASVLVTKTLVIGTANKRAAGNPVEWSDPDVEQQVMFVFDKTDGTHLRTIRLDGLSTGAPMTYLYNGKQYIALAVGRANTAALVALSLPD